MISFSLRDKSVDYHLLLQLRKLQHEVFPKITQGKGRDAAIDLGAQGPSLMLTHGPRQPQLPAAATA